MTDPIRTAPRVDREIGDEIHARLKHLAEELDAQVSSGGSI